MKSLTLANINTRQHQGILTKYISSRALYEATKVSLEDAGLFVQVFSFGNCDGLKDLNMDMDAFHAAKKRITRDVTDRLKEISAKGKRCLPAYRDYLTSLSLQTTNIKREMEVIRKEVEQHNKTQSKLAALFGKLYSTLKFAADTGFELLSKSIGPAGIAASYMYGLGTELATTIAEADKADIWSFSGSLSAPYLMSWGVMKKAIHQPSLGVKVISASVDVLPNVLITKGFLDNLAKFEY